MRQFVVEGWNAVMDHNSNPLRNIPDLSVRHMVMQVLAFMWSSVFAIMIVNSVTAFMYSAVGHVIFVGAIVITVGTFKVAENRPYMFGSYHSYGRARGYTLWHDKHGNPHKVYFDKNDPGGEYE